MITQKQIGMAETLAARFAAIPGVKSAKVDDWSDYGYFAIFIDLKGKWTGGSRSFFIPEGENLAMRRGGRIMVRQVALDIRSILLRAKKADEIFSYDQADAPHGIYHQCFGYQEFDGYDKSDFKINFRIPEGFPVEKTAESKKVEVL